VRREGDGKGSGILGGMNWCLKRTRNICSSAAFGLGCMDDSGLHGNQRRQALAVAEDGVAAWGAKVTRCPLN
jgi:hypothetical protein